MTKSDIGFWLKEAEKLDALECDCGRTKRNKKDEACERCMFLDGSRDGEADIISLLRTAPDGMTLREIGDHLDRFPSALALSLKLLMERGRITRYQRELEGKEGTGTNGALAGKRMVCGARTCWVYQLAIRSMAA